MFKTGDLFDSGCEALVNCVNCVGVMGCGIALQFKLRFPKMFRAYRVACDLQEVEIGKMHVWENAAGETPKYIINFPTKNEWRKPSQIDYITKGLADLRQVIETYKIKSIAIPALGCSNGGLDWAEVRPIIENLAKSLSGVEIVVYEPQKN